MTIRTPSQVVTIDKSTWETFAQHAKHLGISQTSYLEMVIKTVNKNPITPKSFFLNNIQKKENISSHPSSDYIEMIKTSPLYAEIQEESDIYSSQDGSPL